MKNNQIGVIYGSNPVYMVKELMNNYDIADEIDKNSVIGLKPNLVVAKKSDSGATTTPEILQGVIEYLNENGIKKIVILEGSWVGDSTTKAYKVCGYTDISKRYNVPLYDLQKDSYKGYTIDGIKINVCEKVSGIDYLINLPILKGHCQTKITCALKNLKGLIPDKEKRHFHSMGLHKPIAYLNKIVKQNLIIVDGLNGDLTYEEGGTPVEMNRIMIAKDPVLIDSYVCQLMGYSLDEVDYVKIAEKIGIGSSDLNQSVIDELNKAENKTEIKSPRKVERLAKNVIQNSACSACYGSLIHALKRLDEKGLLNKIKDKIYIGQGFKGEKEEGIGIGVCTSCFDKSIKGCPPNAVDIVNYLIKEI